MLKRPHYIALIAVVLLVVVLLKLPTAGMARFKLAVSGLFLPLFGLAGSSAQLAEKAGNTVVPRSELQQQNDLLRRDNSQLRILQQQNDTALRENNRLRDLVGWQKQSRWKLKLARVIARDPANWWRTLQIDVGSRDGLQPNAPVLTTDGLVGRVSAVGTSRSQVLLLGDPSLRVGAVVEETRETGVILANTTNPLENNMIDFGYLSGNSALRPNQLVVTSGDGGVFPRGILIGSIVDVRSANYGLTREARVKLAAHINALDEVWVLLP